MKRLFSPAIALMNRLSYTWKFMVLWLIYLIAITVVMHNLYESLNQVSHTSQQELKGIALIKPISVTVQFMQQHRGLSVGFLGGIKEFRAARAAKLIETSAAFFALKSLLPIHLILSEEWIRIESNWYRLQADGLNWAVEENFAAHTHLINALLDFEMVVADEYALTIDPDLGSSYLIDTAIWKLPRALERLGQVRAFGAGILAKKQLSESQKIILITLIAQLDDTLKTLVINFAKTSQFNAQTQPRLSEASKDILDSSHKIVDLVRSDILTGHFSESPKQFFKTTTDMINSNYTQIYEVLLPTAQMLINERIKHADQKIRISIGTVSLLLLLAYYFFIGSYYAMKGSIQALADSARIFAGGDLRERVDLGTHDELCQVADSFNEMADGFQTLLTAHIEDENRLRAITDNARTIIFMKDVSGRYIHVNRLYEELFHIDKAAIYGKTAHDIFPPEIADAIRKSEQEVIRSGQPLEVEELIPQDDGQHTYISVKFPLRKISGEIYAICGIATDITERKRAEQALIASETFHRAVFDAAPDAILISDEQGIITQVNQYAEELLGYLNGELPGQSIDILVPEHLRSRHKILHSMFAADPSPRSMGTGREIRALRKDGLEIDVEISLSPIQTQHGLRIASVVCDITQRKQTEAELRIAAAAFESHEAMVITDPNAVILRVNKTFIESTGYTAEESVGHKMSFLKSGLHDEAFYTVMWESILNTGTWQGEIWDRRKNGDIYPKWLTITAVTNNTHLVTHFVVTHLDITERKAAEDEIKQLAFYDPLTRLPNRRLLLNLLQQAKAYSSRSGMHGAVMFIDLDNFKTLNDTLGHDKGDLLLQQVANRLKTCVRECDIVARLGGDEFVIMLENLSKKSHEATVQVETVGEKILAVLNQPYQLASHKHYSTPSIGITMFSNHGRSIDELLKQADIAMYQSKAAGRNTLHFFDQSMQTSLIERASLETNLHQGLRKKQFILYYQPQVDDEGRITGAEALVRWQHSRLGMVSPAEFIPLAEETGLILPLGHWVLETACTQLATWAIQAETAHLELAVNVSARQFRQADFVDQVMAVLNHTGADPHKLKIELTESILVSNVEDIITKMTALKAKGVGFSLDDFGTGYSSLYYLKQLPLDQLKIDQSFIRDILIDLNDAAIAKMIVALAESMGLSVIAEGVETQPQRDFLARHGCHAYQGYLFSRPLALEAFDEFVTRV
ncbi:MAG: EAL domain-containing protein [Methylobacter sp.]|nr:EAL domain-containing protein [Methylobacter sp.]